MVKQKYTFGLELFFRLVFHVLYIGLADDGDVFDIVVGIRNVLLQNFEYIYVREEMGCSYLLHFLIPPWTVSRQAYP